MLTIYGKRLTRAGRCLWALEELGLPYRCIPLDPSRGETRSDDYLSLNPVGKVPLLLDGDFALRESLAINAYLVAQQPTPLWPDDARTRARIGQWSCWAATEVEFHFTVMVRELRRAAGGTPDAAVIEGCLGAIGTTLEVLEQALLEDGPYVAGDAFTVGDINTAFPILGIAPRLDMTRFPAVAGWLARCGARPAWQRVQARDEAALRAEYQLAA